MRQKHGTQKPPAEKVMKDIRRRTRKQHSAEEKIRIVLEGLRGEESITELCRREGIATSLYYSWSKEFLEAGKKRLAGDTARQATSHPEGEKEDQGRNHPSAPLAQPEPSSITSTQPSQTLLNVTVSGGPDYLTTDNVE